MACQSPGFVVGFLPGLLLGCCSALLLVTLWNSPVTVHYTKERQVSDVNIILDHHSIRKQLETVECGKMYLASSMDAQEEPYLLLILVHSSPSSLQRRKAIRETWLHNNNKQRKYVAKFVIGTASLSPKDLELLACENKEQSDMVFLPNHCDNDAEYSSSQKLLQSFKWAEEEVAYSYLFKCMDSTFVILDVLLNELEGRTQTTDLLWGFFAGGIRATREGHLKENQWFLCTHYLPYPQGGGYVISQGLVSMIHMLGPDLEHYLHDDIALGVWLSPFKGIQHIHDVRFNTGYYSRGCSNVYVVTHRETVQTMRNKHASVERKGPFCEAELVSKPSYIYDWTVPSDRCCVRKMGIP